MSSRRVILVCGAPGAGKTTFAHATGLAVYDLDDPHWHGSERLFREALRALAQDPYAQAAVIRCAATPSARSKAAKLCGATEAVVIDTALPLCVERIAHRGRGDIRSQIAAAQTWWKAYVPDPAGGAYERRHAAAPLTTSRDW